MTPAPAPSPTSYRVTQSRVLRSEWSKLWSLRSTWIALAVAALLTIGLGLIVAQQYTPEQRNDVDPVLFSLLGTQFGQVIIAVLGILVTAGEYSTGMIRATMSAVPRRLPVLWAKATVFGTVAFGTVLVSVFAAFLGTQALLDGTDKEAALGDPGVVRALAGAAAAIALIGVLTLAFGSLLRSVPGALGAYVGGLVVLPQIAAMIPTDGMDTVIRHFPLQAAEALAAMTPAEGALAPGPALLTLCAWAAAGLAAAAVLLARRDV